MKRILISPSKYIQGEGELENLGMYVNELGGRALVVASGSCENRTRAAIDRAKKSSPFFCVYGNFRGESTRAEIEKMKSLAEAGDCSVIIGLGGGKAIDTAKAAAFLSEKPVIVAPTIASTDAPTSKLAIVYSEEGVFEEYFHLGRNPDIVLVDTGIAARAPVRFLVAGMGDALATYFEARSCIASNSNNMSGGKSTKAAFAIAKACFDTLMEDSVEAIKACEENRVNLALENIVEANTLLSGIGFESSGLAAAHSIHDGLTVLEETHQCYHGEKVAFGTLVHLVLENAPPAEIKKVLNYCRSVGLPTCLDDLGITDVTEEKIMAVAEASCAEGETIVNMPFKVTPGDVYNAILTADRLGTGR